MRDEDPIKLILRDLSLEMIEADFQEFERKVFKWN